MAARKAARCSEYLTVIATGRYNLRLRFSEYGGVNLLMGRSERRPIIRSEEIKAIGSGVVAC